MNAPRSWVVFTAACSLCLVVALGWQVRRNFTLRSERARRSDGDAEAVARLQELIRAETKRVSTAEAQVRDLREAAKRNAAQQAPSTRPLGTDDTAKAALKRGGELIGEGKLQEALDEYVKCYREQQTANPGSPECQRLTSALLSLGRRYPPARDAVALLRDTAMAQLQAEPTRTELAFEIALLNERLGQAERTVALFEALPANDIRRPALAKFALKPLIAAGRYNDALVGRSFGQMLRNLEVAAGGLSQVPSELQSRASASVIETALVDIEVLTGAGRDDEARVLTEKLLALDHSDVTRANIERHVTRATTGKP